MKILFMNNTPLIKYGLAEGLQELGHETLVLNTWQHHQNKEDDSFLHNIFQDYKPDAFITEGFPGFPSAWVQHLREKFNIPHLYWAIEDPVLFENSLQHWVPISDYIFTTTVELVDEYLKRGVPAELMLFGCSKNWHKKVQPADGYKVDIVFVGSNYSIRDHATERLIKPLLNSQYSIHIYGNSAWLDQRRKLNLSDYPHVYKGILPYEDLDKVYSSAKIVLGLHCDDSSVTQTSMRTYEVLGCGAFYLTQYTKAHEHLFTIGRELEAVREEEDFLEKIRFYLNNEKLRRQISETGQKKVYEQHTYTHRAKQIINAIHKLKQS